MKALGLVRISQKINSVRILGATIWAEINRESFSMFFFLQLYYFSGEHFKSCTNFHGGFSRKPPRYKGAFLPLK